MGWGPGCVPAPRNYSRRAPRLPTRRLPTGRKGGRPRGASPPARPALTAGPTGTARPGRTTGPVVLPGRSIALGCGRLLALGVAPPAGGVPDLEVVVDADQHDLLVQPGERGQALIQGDAA